MVGLAVMLMVGCGGGDPTEPTPEEISSESIGDGAIPCAQGANAPARHLTASEVRVPPGMELAPNPAKLASDCTETADSAVAGLSQRQVESLRDEDLAWRAADGTRYESMLVLADGTSYGRKSASPTIATIPNEGNRFGAFEGDPPSDEEIAQGVEVLEQANAGADPEGSAELDVSVEENPFANEDNLARGIIGSTLNSDRRSRTTQTAQLTAYPLRTIGTLNNQSVANVPASTQNCTGTKVGPRHVLTASHCVLSATGSMVTSGWFHPGQTNDAHPNTSGTAVSWSGVALRDWRGGNSNRRYDYALLYLDDRLDSYSLGWLGIEWWNSSGSYNGKNADINGYPYKAGGQDAWRCKASVLSPKECDGWMYFDAAVLDANAFRSDEQLEYDIDTSKGQSGSALKRNAGGGAWTALGVNWGCDGFGGCGSSRNRAARFRQSMFDDVCAWIKVAPSAHGQHPICF